jgi:hypothetical protein
MHFMEMDNGHNRIHAFVTILCPGFDMYPVHERVRKRCGKFLQVCGRQRAPDKKELRSVDRFSFHKFHGQEIFDRLPGCGADIIGNARKKSYFYCVIEWHQGWRVYQEFLDNGIDELRADIGKFLSGKIAGTGGDSIDIDEMQFIYRKT